MRTCHAERSEGSHSWAEILRFAQDDKRRDSQDDTVEFMMTRKEVDLVDAW